MAGKILVVDDEPHIRRSLESRLTHSSYEVELAENGQEALNKFKEGMVAKTPYSLILLDIIMPGLNGLEVLEQIRQLEAENKIGEDGRTPIIMLTALKDSWETDAKHEGCDDYVIKPFAGDDLMRVIKKAIRT